MDINSCLKIEGKVWREEPDQHWRGWGAGGGGGGGGRRREKREMIC